jgi:hypothetical protein
MFDRVAEDRLGAFGCLCSVVCTCLMGMKVSIRHSSANAVDKDGRPLLLCPNTVFLLGQSDTMKKSLAFGKVLAASIGLPVSHDGGSSRFSSGSFSWASRAFRRGR